MKYISKFFFLGQSLLNFYAMLKIWNGSLHLWNLDFTQTPRTFFLTLCQDNFVNKILLFTFPWDGLWGWFYYKTIFNMYISFQKVGIPRDACKDKTEMIFLIFFMVSFWYQSGIKKIIKIPNEYGIQASKRSFFKAKMRSDHGSC